MTLILGLLLISIVAGQSGTCGAQPLDCSWRMEGQKLIIEGTGEMTNYDSWSPSAPWKSSGATSVEIKEGITSIGTHAFYEMTSIQSVKIPNSVETIGGSAFCECSGLTSVNIPNSVTSIGESAFAECGGLTNIDIPNSVTSIDQFAFSYCSGLTNIDIPNSVTTIGWSSFRGCTGLISVVIPNLVKRIDDYAFADCTELTSVVYTGTNKYKTETGEMETMTCGDNPFDQFSGKIVVTSEFPDGQTFCGISVEVNDKICLDNTQKYGSIVTSESECGCVSFSKPVSNTYKCTCDYTVESYENTNTCPECIDNSHCANNKEGKLQCSNNECVECIENSHCKDTSKQQCNEDNQCVECIENSHCKDTSKQQCNEDNQCVECTKDEHCKGKEGGKTKCDKNVCSPDGAFSTFILLILTIILIIV